MNIVVDTNIIFSALLNVSNVFTDIIAGGDSLFSFYVPEYTFVELKRHDAKLLKASKLNADDLDLVRQKLFSFVEVVNPEVISEEIWRVAEEIVFDIDPNDAPFIALSLYLNADLWTGDKHLYNGLRAKGYYRILSTPEMLSKLTNFKPTLPSSLHTPNQRRIIPSKPE